MTGPQRKKRKSHTASTEHTITMPPPIRVPMQNDSSMPLGSLSPGPSQSPSLGSTPGTPQVPSQSRSLGSTPQVSTSLGSIHGTPQVPESPMSVVSEVGHNRLMIYPQGDYEFTYENKCSRAIGDIIRENYHGFWPWWKDVPFMHKKMMFGEFVKKFVWPENKRFKIWKIFCIRARLILKNRLARARKPIRKQPQWIGDENWKKLCDLWDTPEYQKKSEIAKKKRASDCGGEGFPLHKGGSRSHLMHFQDMKTANGGTPPSMSQYFLSLRSSMDENGEIKFVDERSKRTYNKWQTKRAEHQIPQNLEGTSIEFQEWAEEQGGPNKDGFVYGLGGAASFVTAPKTSNPPCTSSMENATEAATQNLLAAQIEENKKMKEELETLKKMVVDLSSQFQAARAPLWTPANQGPYFMSSPGFMPSSGFMPSGFVSHTRITPSTAAQVHNTTSTSTPIIEMGKQQIALNNVGDEGTYIDEEDEEEGEDEEL